MSVSSEHGVLVLVSRTEILNRCRGQIGLISLLRLLTTAEDRWFGGDHHHVLSFYSAPRVGGQGALYPSNLLQLSSSSFGRFIYFSQEALLCRHLIGQIFPCDTDTCLGHVSLGLGVS